MGYTLFFGAAQDARALHIYIKKYLFFLLLALHFFHYHFDTLYLYKYRIYIIP